MANRTKWLDASRGICFLMVIYSHLEYCNQYLMLYFAPVFLSSFFLVSGYLFKNGMSFSVVLEQRTRTLFLPFVIYGLVLIGMSHIYTTKDNVEPFISSFISYLLQDGKNNIIWFIPSLYVYSLAFYWIDKWCKNIKQLATAIILIMLINWVAIEIFYLGYLPYNLQCLGYAIFWMGCGRILRQFNLQSMMNGKICVVASIAYIALIALTKQYYSFAGSPFLIDWLIVCLLGLYCIIYLSQKILPKFKLLMFVGANTLLYFILHGKVYAIMESVLIRIVPISILQKPLIFDTMGFVLTFLDALVLILPIIFINKYLSFTIGRGFKLWK